MNYDKIKSLCKARNISQDSLAVKIGISSGGFKLNLKKKNMMVSNLEKISKVFNLPMSYWWEDEKNMAMEQQVEYEKTHKKTVDELTDTIAYFKNRCEKLEKEVEQLKRENQNGEKKAC